MRAMWKNDFFISIELSETFEVQVKQIFIYLSQPYINGSLVITAGQIDRVASLLLLCRIVLSSPIF